MKSWIGTGLLSRCRLARSLPGSSLLLEEVVAILRKSLLSKAAWPKAGILISPPASLSETRGDMKAPAFKEQLVHVHIPNLTG